MKKFLESALSRGKMQVAALLIAALASLLPGLAAAATMQCLPNQVTQAVTATYTADTAGIVTAVAGNDVNALHQAGCMQIGIGGGPTLLGRLVGADFNVVTDQIIPWFVPSGHTYQITAIAVRNPSTSLTTAAGGFYTAAGKTGTTLVAATQVYTGATGAATVQNVTIAAAGLAANLGAAVPPIFALTTAQGVAAKGDIFVYGYVGQ
jgi:hypothetical protein